MSSSTSTPVPTPSFDPNPTQPLWAPPNRGIYTYSFLGGMGLISFIVLIFVARAYSRRRRFAARVQRALDAGRLDPALVEEIRNLPSGALYFTPSSRKKLRIRPVMYEVYLGDPESKGPSFSGNEKAKGTIDWTKITPIAASKLIPKAEDQVKRSTMPPTEPGSAPRRSRLNFMSSVSSPTRSEATAQPVTNPDPSPPTIQAPSAPPPGSLALSVFIAMPSPSCRLSRAKLDGEEVVPDVCLGVTRVDMTT